MNDTLYLANYQNWPEIFSNNFKTVLAFLSQESSIMLLALVVELIVIVPNKFRISAFADTFSYLSKKVNKKSYASHDKIFAGFLLPSLIIIIFYLLIVIFDILADFDSFISFIVLILVLDNHQIANDSIKIFKLLNRNQKDQARLYLQNMVLRDCHNLSTMGICKACCENIAIRSFVNFAILFWFMLASFEGAVIMRLCYELAHIYNMKKEEYRFFGVGSFRIEQTLLFFPALIFILFNACNLNYKKFINEALRANKTYPAYNTGLILGTIGLKLDLKFGGPRYYGKELIRYENIGGSQNPTPDSILKLMHKMRFYTIILCIIFLISQNFIL